MKGQRGRSGSSGLEQDESDDRPMTVSDLFYSLGDPQVALSRLNAGQLEHAGTRGNGEGGSDGSKSSNGKASNKFASGKKSGSVRNGTHGDKAANKAAKNVDGQSTPDSASPNAAADYNRAILTHLIASQSSTGSGKQRPRVANLQRRLRSWETQHSPRVDSENVSIVGVDAAVDTDSDINDGSSGMDTSGGTGGGHAKGKRKGKGNAKSNDGRQAASHDPPADYQPRPMGRKRRRNSFILSYNRALMMHTEGHVKESLQLCHDQLTSIMQSHADQKNQRQQQSQQQKGGQQQADGDFPNALVAVGSRLGFLYLENLLHVSLGNPLGVHARSSTTKNGGPSENTLTASAVLDWLGKLATANEASHQLKFQVSLYRSRVEFADRQKPSRIQESNVRQARKELKQAMEIFQQKLRPSSATSSSAPDALSLGGNSSVLSMEDVPNATTVNAETSITMIPGPAAGSARNGTNATDLSRVLQAQQQTALNLKANVEQLKGNVKKSLILCAEAQASLPVEHGNTSIVDVNGNEATIAADVPSSSYYDALHANNLALVYQTHGKRFLALHTLSKALRDAAAWSSMSSTVSDGTDAHATQSGDGNHEKTGHIENGSGAGTNDPQAGSSSLATFAPDGTARPDPTLLILYNSALCAARCQRFESAYECMSICLRYSQSTFAQQPRCWLRLGEFCIGIHHGNRQKERQQQDGTAAFASVVGTGSGILLKSTMANKMGSNHDGDSNHGGDEDNSNGASLRLGTAGDIERVRSRPLPRARLALEKALQLHSRRGEQPNSNTTLADAENVDEKKYRSKHVDIAGKIAAHLSLSYVHLELQQYHEALQHAEHVMSMAVLDSTTHTTTETNMDTSGVDQRQVSTARMYAAEACCMLGDPGKAMQYLAGDGSTMDEAAIDRLASALAGTNMDPQDQKQQQQQKQADAGVGDGISRIRLGKAQQMLRSTASVISAHMGDTKAAKEWATSANAQTETEEASASAGPNRPIFSEGQQALMYCMLRAGDTSAALKLLLGSRS